nr:MAG TPA: hypothetical protein [Caudoviricetes sp.]
MIFHDSSPCILLITYIITFYIKMLFKNFSSYHMITF